MALHFCLNGIKKYFTKRNPTQRVLLWCCCSLSLDSIDTRSALEHIRELVTAGNAYIAQARASKRRPNRRLLENVAIYITDLFKVGAKDDEHRSLFWWQWWCSVAAAAAAVTGWWPVCVGVSLHVSNVQAIILLYCYAVKYLLHLKRERK